MNWSSERFLRKTYEKWKTYERLGQHTNKLEFRFFRKTDEGSGRHTNELEIRKIFEEDIRKKWKIYERLGQHTNELEFRKIF